MKKSIKYLILGNDWDLYLFSWSDVYEMKNVTYVPGRYPKFCSFKGLLYRLHFNKYLSLPWKDLWSRLYIPSNIKPEDSLCVIVLDCWICPDGIRVIEYIQRTYKRAKFVLKLQDLVRFRLTNMNYTESDFDKLRSRFDLILSFDPGDCEKYGLDYYPLCFSGYTDEMQNMENADVYFLGKAKDRFAEIVNVYNFLKSKGLKCNFNIIGVRKEDQVEIEGVNYLESMSYKQNLQCILHSNCILELMQGGGRGYTQRVLEAICLKRKLLTNNPIIKDALFYNPRLICAFSSLQDIDLNFLENIKQNGAVEYKDAPDFSPRRFIAFIEQKLFS